MPLFQWVKKSLHCSRVSLTGNETVQQHYHYKGDLWFLEFGGMKGSLQEKEFFVKVSEKWK